MININIKLNYFSVLYSLSSLGETACNSIVRTHGAVEALVSLVTVEAQSYGPKACILMRVVETVPGASAASASNSTATATAGTSGAPQTQTQQQPQVGATAQLQQLKPVTVPTGKSNF